MLDLRGSYSCLEGSCGVVSWGSYRAAADSYSNPFAFHRLFKSVSWFPPGGLGGVSDRWQPILIPGPVQSFVGEGLYSQK